MKIRLLSIFVFCLFLIKTSLIYANEEVYFCVAEDTNGFYQVKKDKFERSGFYGERYTVKIDFENEYIDSEDLLIDSSMQGHNCDYTPYRTSNNQMDVMSCYNNFGNSFAINKKNLKFIHTYGVGYIADTQTNTDDIFISYGKCQKF